MPDLTRSARADYDTTTAQRASVLSNVVAAAEIPFAGVPLTYVADSTGESSSGLACRPAAPGESITGWSSRRALTGEPVTVYGNGVRFNQVTTGLTPGQLIYRGAAAGGLQTTVNGAPIAVAVSSTDILTGGVL